MTMAMQTERVGEPAQPHESQRLIDLLHESVASAPAEQGDRLGEAFCLYCDMRPAPSGVTVPDPRDFGHLLASGAFESAALALIGPQSSWLLSRSAAGTSMATVKLPGRGAESTVEAATPALALLCAQLACLAEDTICVPLATETTASAQITPRLH